MIYGWGGAFKPRVKTMTTDQDSKDNKDNRNEESNNKNKVTKKTTTIRITKTMTIKIMRANLMTTKTTLTPYLSYPSSLITIVIRDTLSPK